MDLIRVLTESQMKAEPPVATVGDTVRVHVKVKEGSRERIQVFEGTVIAKKHGGIHQTLLAETDSNAPQPGHGFDIFFAIFIFNINAIATCDDQRPLRRMRNRIRIGMHMKGNVVTALL